MTLLALQRDFRSWLLARDGAIRPRIANDAAPGLAVYHHAYRAQLVAALKDSFERTWAWLGDNGFEAAARDHIAGTPPSSWTLGDYGTQFAATLRALYPYDPEVPEIAALDWALRRAFDGPDGARITPAQLAEADWDRARINFLPTVALVAVTTNSAMLWNAMASGEPIPAVELLDRPATLLVWRDELQPRFETIDDQERDAIAAALSGETFTRICERLSADLGVEEAVGAASRYLAAWLERGIITSLA